MISIPVAFVTFRDCNCCSTIELRPTTLMLLVTVYCPERQAACNVNVHLENKTTHKPKIENSP